MSTDQHSPANSAIPVFIITGFLGSGKTTLLNQLIKHPDMSNSAVLVNEFGEVGLDHILVEAVTEEIVLLPSGCICCQIQGDLVTTLVDLYEKRKDGSIDKFDRVIIETTGIADPVPVMKIILTDEQLRMNYQFTKLLTVVDSIFGESQLKAHQEAARQIIFADKIVLTKSELSVNNQLASLEKTIRLYNRQAPLLYSNAAGFSPDDLLGGVNGDSHFCVAKFDDFSEELTSFSPLTESSTKANKHSFATTNITLDEPIYWHPFQCWLNDLMFARANNILRIKGILDVKGQQRPLVIHGIQNMIFPPELLDDWPTESRVSHIVFITDGFNPGGLGKSLKDYLMLKTTALSNPSFNTP